MTATSGSNVPTTTWYISAPLRQTRFQYFVELVLDHACDITRHAGGCWILNRSPLRRVWWWSTGK